MTTRRRNILRRQNAINNNKPIIKIPTKERFEESKKFLILLFNLISYAVFNGISLMKKAVLSILKKIRKNLEKKKIIIDTAEESYNILNKRSYEGTMVYLLYIMYLEPEERTKLYNKLELIINTLNEMGKILDIEDEELIGSITYDEIIELYNVVNPEIEKEKRRQEAIKNNQGASATSGNVKVLKQTLFRPTFGVGGKVGKYTKKRKSKRKKRKSKRKKRKSKRKKRKSKRKKRKIKKYK